MTQEQNPYRAPLETGRRGSGLALTRIAFGIVSGLVALILFVIGLFSLLALIAVLMGVR